MQHYVNQCEPLHADPKNRDPQRKKGIYIKYLNHYLTSSELLMYYEDLPQRQPLSSMSCEHVPEPMSISIPLITRATLWNRRCSCIKMFHTIILAAKTIFAQLLLESLPQTGQLICHKWRVQEWPCEKVQAIH